MKKLFLSLIAVIAGTMGSYAQSDLVATLTHGSSLTTFTGADALSEAYTAAAEGDVITLSPGVFNAVDIEKAITVRGAGMVGMESNGFVSTQLTGDMTINVPSGTSSVLTIDGIHALDNVNVYGTDLSPVKLLRSRFEQAVNGWGVNMQASFCIFAYILKALIHPQNSPNKNTILNCSNCVIRDARSDGYDSSVVAKIVATNCVLTATGWTSYGVQYSVFNNCIIIVYDSNHPDLSNTCSIQNCIGIDGYNFYDTPRNIFVNIIDPSNVMAEGTGEAAFTPIFKTLKSLSSNPAITETFELTETAAATYLGNDGTQVGIYGGSYPFDPTPTNPQVKKFTVSNTTDGGTLKVKINVE